MDTEMTGAEGMVLTTDAGARTEKVAFVKRQRTEEQARGTDGASWGPRIEVNKMEYVETG
ncbi:hypothetical protein F444_11278 [Phytophthora nicotianae P1976]|uniref:Uncharacterized protein n=1 Tax=Phytophthora nicotianae P1976 TaxID=1317066 RepID=A0A081A1F1_PHYNI|nr:hypothetical protein F444_11278 [Phytophthora nicotianae P1976]